MEPLRIVIFEGSLQPPVFITRLIEGLAARGHDVYLLHSEKNKISSVRNLHYVSLGSSKSTSHLLLHSLHSAFKRKTPAIWDTLKTIAQTNRKNLQKRNLKLVLQEINPHIIHVQWPSLLDVLEEILKERKIPVILSQRGYQINVKPFISKIYYRKLAEIFPKISGFHSVSRAISGRGDQIYSSSKKIDEVIYTGIDLKNFPFGDKFKRNKKLKILTVGRPHWKKGLNFAILACDLLQNKNIDFEYIIIGGVGNEEILFLRNQLGLENKVRIAGKLSQKKVYELMMESDLLLVPSIEEGIPNVLVEAMALGLPVLSTSCGGVEELVEHEISGWVVPTRDSAAIAKQIENFNDLPGNTLFEIRKAARRKVEQQHSEKKMVEEMEEFYRKIIKNKQP